MTSVKVPTPIVKVPVPCEGGDGLVDYSDDGSISLILLPRNTPSLLIWLPEYFWYKVWMTSVKVTKIWFKILAMDLTYSDPSR